VCQNLPKVFARASIGARLELAVTDRLFAGKYHLKRRLGLGGMAEVWLADLQGPQGFQRELVIKRILPHLADDENFLSMFEDEARLAAQLNHPHAVRVEELGKEDGTWYLAMEYLDGADLRDLARRARGMRQTIPLEVILQIGADVASALHYAHTLSDPQGRPLNLIHRDVSPHNVIVTRNGHAKLVDFGIARAESNQVKTRTGMVKGKSGYMSPEQALGRDLDGRSDQFALGIVLYELLLRARLFRGDSDMAVMRKVVACNIPPLLSIAPDLPESVQVVINKTLQRAPEDRYADGNALSEALLTCLHELGLRGGHHKVGTWVQEMLKSSVVLPQLPSVDDLNQSEPLREELTRLSSQSSTRAARLRSASRSHRPRTEEKAPGTEVTSHTEERYPAMLWGALIAGLIVVLALATNLRSGQPDAEITADPVPVESVVRAPVKAPETVTIRNEIAKAPDAPVPTRVSSGTGSGVSPSKSAPAAPAKMKRKAKVSTAGKAVKMGQSAAKKTVSVQVDIKQRNRHFDWGMVYLNGRAVGMAPVKGAQVPAGSLAICIHNKASGIALRTRVQVSGSNMKFEPFDMAKAKPGKCP